MRDIFISFRRGTWYIKFTWAELFPNQNTNVSKVCDKNKDKVEGFPQNDDRFQKRKINFAKKNSNTHHQHHIAIIPLFHECASAFISSHRLHIRIFFDLVASLYLFLFSHSIVIFAFVEWLDWAVDCIRKW